MKKNTNIFSHIRFRLSDKYLYNKGMIQNVIVITITQLYFIDGEEIYCDERGKEAEKNKSTIIIKFDYHINQFMVDY